MRLLRRQSTRGLVDDLLGDTVGLLGRPTRTMGRNSSRALRTVISGGGRGSEPDLAAANGLGHGALHDVAEQADDGGGGNGSRANGSSAQQ